MVFAATNIAYLTMTGNTFTGRVEADATVDYALLSANTADSYGVTAGVIKPATIVDTNAVV